jgi:hypothetical protein
MVPSMLELIFFYYTYYKKLSRATTEFFVCKSDGYHIVFSGARQQNFAGAGILCSTGMTFDLKNAPAKFYDAIMRVLPPPTAAATAADAATITARLSP